MTGEDRAATDSPADPGALDVIFVSRWFPNHEDQAAGRFVADQVDALAATGMVRAHVLSFDPAQLSGGAASRDRQATAVLEAGLEAVDRAEPLFVPGLPGIHRSVGVSRLTIPEGLTRAAGRAHAAVHRATLLAAAADRMAPGPMEGPHRRVIVHAHTGYPDGAAAIALADRLGAPLFITEHSSFVSRQIAEPAVRGAYAAALARAERLYAVSMTLADELHAAFPERADRISVLPNAVHVDRFPLASSAERRPDELLFVGYRKASKGIGTLLHATALAHGKRGTVRLRLVGSNADQDEERGWHELVAELGIGDVVTFEDPRDRDGVAAAMARASLFVHPSPRETFGVVAVEALATGLPVVAADSGGVTEILGAEPDRLGAIVPPNDHEALADAILATLDRLEDFDPAELRASVVRRFGAAYVAERLLADYRHAVAGRSDGIPLAVGPPAAGDSRPVVIVALDRERAANRLRLLPGTVASRATVVTAAEPRDVPVALNAAARVIEVDLDPSWRPVADKGSIRRQPGTMGRIARLVTEPRATIRRRLGRDAGAEASLKPATVALRRLASERGSVEDDGPESGLPIEVIAVDGHDHLAVEPLARAGIVRRFPGGLRRLVDVAETSDLAGENG